MTPKFVAHASRNLAARSVEIILGSEDASRDRTAIAGPVEIVFSPHDPGEMIERPTLRLHQDLALALFQALYDAGLRPNDGEGSSGQVAALRSHIKFAEAIAVETTRALSRLAK